MSYKKGQKVTILIHGAGVVSEETDHVIEKVDKTHLSLEGLENTKFDVKTGRTNAADSFCGFWFEIVKDGVPHVVSAPAKVVKKVQAQSKSEAKRIAIQAAHISKALRKSISDAKTRVTQGHDGKRVKLTQKEIKRRYGKSTFAEENSVR